MLQLAQSNDGAGNDGAAAHTRWGEFRALRATSCLSTLDFAYDQLFIARTNNVLSLWVCFLVV